MLAIVQHMSSLSFFLRKPSFICTMNLCDHTSIQLLIHTKWKRWALGMVEWRGNSRLPVMAIGIL